jgi:F0F1-type ATP synthase assembly protein I
MEGSIMPTRIGFYFFAGAVLGALIGIKLPFAASVESVAGAVIGIVLAFIIDKREQKNTSE